MRRQKKSLRLTERLRLSQSPMLYALLMLSIILAACQQSGEKDRSKSPPQRLKVYTPLAPLESFAARLLGELGEVTLATPPDQDPARWIPSKDQLIAYQRASLILLNGAGFEQWRDQVSLPHSRVVETALPFKEAWLHYPKAQVHQHGAEGLHSHEGLDGHTWLDPLLAKEQAGAIERALARLLPREARGALRDRLQRLSEELDGLHEGWRALAPKLRTRTLIANHPAYQYLAARHQLKIESLDLDPEAPLAESVMEELRRRAPKTDTPPALLFWEAQPLQETLTALRTLKIESVWVSPSEGADPQGRSYTERQRANLARLQEALAR